MIFSLQLVVDFIYMYISDGTDLRDKRAPETIKSAFSLAIRIMPQE